MRTIGFVVMAVLFVVLSEPVRADPSAELQRLHWLIGTWERVDLPEGREGREIWSANRAEPGLSGRGIATRRDGSRFEEALQIVIHDGAVHYVADVPGNPAPVYFRLAEIGENSVVFANLAHNFPQVIAYRRDGDALLAQVSAGDRQIEFRFRRQP